MKINKISYKIACDMNGCKKLADYAAENSENGFLFNICKDCAKELCAELNKNLKGAENAKKN